MASAISRKWSYRAGYVLLCGVLIFFKMLPLGTVPSRIPGPDLIFVFTAAWVLRRPVYVPVLAIAGVHFLTDLMFLRPPGLWTALCLLGYEFLRTRRFGPVEITLPVEIILVALTFSATVVAYLLVLKLLLVPAPGLLPMALHVLTTIAAYPFAVAISHFIFDVKRGRRGDVDADGDTA